MPAYLDARQASRKDTNEPYEAFSLPGEALSHRGGCVIFEWEHHDFVWNAVEELARMVVELRRLDRLVDRVPSGFSGRDDLIREFVDLNFFFNV